MNHEDKTIKSAGEETKPERDILKEITVAYSNLDEKGKKALFKFIHKKHPEEITKIARIISNKIGGIQHPTIISRSSEKISNEIDAILCKDIIPKFFLHSIVSFVYNERFERITWLTENYNICLKDPELFKQNFNSASPDDLFNELIYLVYDLAPSKKKEIDHFEFLIMNLSDKANKLSNYSEIVKQLAQTIQDACDFDQDEVKEMIEDVHRLISSLKEDLENTGKEVGVSVNKWKSRRELDAQINKIEKAISDSKNDVKTLSEFLLGLSGLLKELVIEHRSIIEKKRYSELRNKGSIELEEAAKSKKRININGPDSPLPWLKWIGDLSGTDLDAQGKSLEDQDLPNLAQFIHVFDVAWLPKEKVNDKEAHEEKPETTNMEESPPKNEPLKKSSVIQKEEKPEDIKSSLGIADKKDDIAIPVKVVEKSKEEKNIDQLLQIAEKDISQSASQYKRNPNKENLNELTWNLVSKKELSCAYLINSVLENNEEGLVGILETVILSPKANIDQIAIINHIQKTYERLDSERLASINNVFWQKTVNLMLFSGCFQAALCSLYTNAFQIISSLHLGEYQKLFQLIQHAISFAKKAQPLSPDILLKSMNDQDRKKEIDKLVAEVKDWWATKTLSQLNFQGAIEIWKKWMKEGYPIWRLLNPIINWDENKIRGLKAVLRDIDFDNEIDTLRKELKKRQAMVGTARKDLLKHAREAQTFAMRATQLIEAISQDNENYQKNNIENFKMIYEQYSNGAISEMREIEANAQLPFILRVAAGLAHDTINKVELFIKNPTQDKIVVHPLLLTHEALLRIPGIAVNEKWETGLKPLELVGKIIDALTTILPDAKHSFELHVKSGDLLKAQRILDFIKISGGMAESEYNKLLQEKEASFLVHWDKLKKDFIEIEKEIKEAESKGAIGYQTFLDITAAIDIIKISIANNENEPIETFLQFSNEIKNIRKSLFSDRDRSIEAVRSRVEKMKLSEKTRKRIDAALENSDLHLAFDFIEKTENGLSLPEENSTLNVAMLLKCFPWGDSKDKAECVFDLLYKLFDKFKSSEISFIKNISEGKEIAGMNFDGVSEGQRKKYAKVLEIWFGMKRLRQIEHVDQIKSIFNGLGFNVLNARKETSGDKIWIKIQTEVIPDARPIAEYGSVYNGNYTVFCTFAQPTVESISNVFESSPFPKSANIVLFFGPLPSVARRKLANLCRKSRRTMLIIDDLMMLFLALVPGSKISMLLELGIPFTYLMPYTTQGGGLPPEMLYGREREIKKLQTVASDGSCLLYGGRQIGKTVLLKHVQRITHQPQKGSIAKYINLIGENIGSSNPSGLIWKVMAKTLQTEGLDIFPAELPRSFDSKQFSEHVERWLKISERRILLLLDEADAFLNDDSNQKMPFIICNELKNLMEKTDRRFKVVLAGLHNVQRSTKIANNPIAHFGTPVCVGPLMNGTDSRAAQALIEEPLKYLGIFFKDPDLPIRILAQANYYPNLIQIYCYNLINQIIERQSALNNENIPPYFIQPADIEELYDRRALREELRLRFELTLNLDPRFKLIAYILAFYDNEYRDGMDLEKIRETALDLWPEGFEELANERTISREAFRNLLEEMVDLGMLRCIGDLKYFKLRSPNVVSLLGSMEQIMEVLAGASNWEKPAQYKAETFRATITDEDRIPRSPLTAVQEGELKCHENRIYYLVGTRALESGEVGTALKKSYEKAVLIITGENSFDDFVEKLDDFTKKRQEQNSFVLVEESSNWNEVWVEKAKKKLDGLKLIDANVGIIFMCDHKRLWKDWEYLNGLNFAKSIYLQPWDESMIRFWIKDSQVQLLDQDIPDFIKTTGSWPYMISKLVQFDPNKPLTGDILKAFDNDFYSDESLNKDIMKIFGINVHEPRPVLEVLAEYDDFLAIEEIQTLLSDKSIEKPFSEIKKSLDWADRLNLVKFKELKWKIDPIIKKLFSMQQISQK